MTIMVLFSISLSLFWAWFTWLDLRNGLADTLLVLPEYFFSSSLREATSPTKY